MVCLVRGNLSSVPPCRATVLLLEFRRDLSNADPSFEGGPVAGLRLSGDDARGGTVTRVPFSVL
jgi:hypothetical protein